jgi:hypothetical protein
MFTPSSLSSKFTPLRLLFSRIVKVYSFLFTPLSLSWKFTPLGSLFSYHQSLLLLPFVVAVKVCPLVHALIVTIKLDSLLYRCRQILLLQVYSFLVSSNSTPFSPMSLPSKFTLRFTHLPLSSNFTPLGYSFLVSSKSTPFSPLSLSSKFTLQFTPLSRVIVKAHSFLIVLVKVYPFIVIVKVYFFVLFRTSSFIDIDQI